MGLTRQNIRRKDIFCGGCFYISQYIEYEPSGFSQELLEGIPRAARLGRKESVGVDTLVRLCAVLNGTIDNIPDNGSQKGGQDGLCFTKEKHVGEK